MELIYNVFSTVIVLGIIPIILGQVWKDIFNGGVFFTYICGFFSMLSIIQIVGIPMVFAFVPFHIQIVVYNSIFLLASGTIFYLNRRKSSKMSLKGTIISALYRLSNYFSSFSIYELFYFTVLVGLLAVEVYFAVFYHVGISRSDDGFYTVLSSSAIYDDGFFKTSTTLGSYIHKVDPKYGLCGIFIFYSYISYMTKLGVAVIQQTVCSTLFLLMANGAFFLLSKTLFNKTEEKENRIMFLVFLSLIILFGYHSPYSLTFRLLGPIWQGKAILAVLITPFLFAIYPQILAEHLSKEKASLMILTSIAATSLTLGGIIAIVIIIGVITGIFMITTKKMNAIIYLPFIYFYPTIIMFAYLIIR